MHVPTFQKSQEDIPKQNEGHLPLVPFCTNQTSEHLYAFLSSPTDFIQTPSPQHPNKQALLQNTNKHHYKTQNPTTTEI